MKAPHEEVWREQKKGVRKAGDTALHLSGSVISSLLTLLVWLRAFYVMEAC